MKPLVAHVLYRLDTGGLESVLVTVINRTAQRYRHAVICLDDFTDFRNRIADTEVKCLALHKRPGKDLCCYARLWRALRRVRPDLVVTYNIGALDAAPVARLAGIRHVVHAERGRDAADPRGDDRHYRRIRRWLSPFISIFLVVSRDLQGWLLDQVKIAATKVRYLPNGIDVARFEVVATPRHARPLLGEFAPPGTLLLATVGRLDTVKDQAGLVTAFDLLRRSVAARGTPLRLVIAGEGRERGNLERQIADRGLRDEVRLLGNRDDVDALLAECDIFVLSSIAEGMPGVLLEAMAAGLPVVATDVGGVSEVVVDGDTGSLVPPSDPAALAAVLGRYVLDQELRVCHGRAGRARVESTFSLEAMLSAYTDVYDSLLAGHPDGLTRRHASMSVDQRGH